MVDLKFGKREAQNKPALRLSSILSGVIPDHPSEIDNIDVGGWQMLGNDRYGTCVAVTWANVRRLMTRLAGREQYPGWSQVAEFYKTQNPGFPDQDDGMYVQEALSYLHHNGGPDGAKPIAFAKVDTSNVDEIEAAIAVFRYIWVGTAVQRANMDDFNQGRPWDYHPGSPISGFHSVIVGGYDSDHVGADEKMVTWATHTGWTEAGWRNSDEAFVVIWPEHLETPAFQQGVDRAKLVDAYQALTGRVLELPPEPEPEPVVVDPADPDDVELGRALRYWMSTRKSWSGKTPAGKLNREAREWLDAKGLWYA